MMRQELKCQSQCLLKDIDGGGKEGQNDGNDGQVQSKGNQLTSYFKKLSCFVEFIPYNKWIWLNRRIRNTFLYLKMIFCFVYEYKN